MTRVLIANTTSYSLFVTLLEVLVSLMTHLCAHAKEGIHVIFGMLTKLMYIIDAALSSTDIITCLAIGLQWATRKHLLFMALKSL